MKSYKSFHVIAIIVVFMAIFGCSDGKIQRQESRPTNPISVDVALQSGQFNLVVDASAVYVRTIKDKNVPVVGSLNFKTGQLSLKQNAKSLVDLVVDMTSWNSGLTLRDDRVMQVFFGIAKDQNQVAVFQVKPIDAKTIESFKANKSLPNVKTQGTLTFVGTKLNLDTELNVRFNQKGRLVVTTTKPFVVKISDLKLDEPLKKLIILCNHKSVEDEVVLNVHLEFEPIAM